MSATLVCTNCGADTGCDPDFPLLSPKQIADIVVNWRCNSCLDEIEEDRRAADSEGEKQ